MVLRNSLLAGLLALACGPGAVMWATAETAAPAPVWVVDPAVPGDNLPPAGRSLFDQLFAVDRNHHAREGEIVRRGGGALQRAAERNQDALGRR